ncbi:MAG: hypothetical protein EOO22_09220 [Comamonadaceae bacterium]|nr:MAG: hypothetical protein EOO22_09220 [Comamonadaceae bacterium]
MNNKSRLRAAGWRAACALVGVLAAADGAAQEHAGFVKNIRGEVRLVDERQAGRLAQPGDSMSALGSIETDATSAASVVLRDGTVMVVGPSSRLELKHFHFDATTHEGGLLVNLLRGSLRMITGLIGKANPDAVRIDTQTATIGIRGTDFVVESDGPR